MAAATPAAAQTKAAVRVEATREETGARLALRWPGAVRVDPGRDGRELTIRASRPLGDAPLDTVPDRLQGWVDNVRYGYDSLLLVLAQGVTAEVSVESNGVTIAFTRERATGRLTVEEQAAEQVAQRRIDYFRAVTLMEQGDVREARSLLGDLLRANPNDVQSTALLAQGEERLGRWREAVGLYDRALELAPNEPSLVTSKNNLLREHGEHARVDWDLFQVKNADVQRIGRLTGSLEVGGNTSVLYALENRDVDVDQAVRADGTVAPFHGSRQRAELTLRHDWPEVQQSRLSLFAAQKTVGAGYVHGWREERSETRAGVAWREPTYTFIEGIVGGGRRDRVFLTHEERLSERWSANLGAGWNRYGLAGAGDLATSATVEGAVRYVLIREWPVTSIAYVLDAEYVARRADRVDEAGVAYLPLPVQTREVHALQLALDDALTDYLRYSIQGGYAYDRRGKGGPQGSLALAYEPLERLELGLRASYTRATARGSGTTATGAGGYLIMRY
nr:tetratricopeptide repeat protein [Azospirillum rugosum]